jgi:hypothetical protein
MARIRSIKPEFWEDRRLAAQLTRDQRLFYVGLWNQADDEGRFLAHPRRLLGAIFPYEEDLPETFACETLSLLSSTGRLVLYVVEGEPYGQLTKFKDHQRINRPTPSRIPPAPVRARSRKAHGALSEDSHPRARTLEQGTGSMEQGMESIAADAAPKSWSARACDIWSDRFGGTAPGGRIGRALKPLIDKQGEEEVLARWKIYVTNKDPEYASPADFASKYATWSNAPPKSKASAQQFDYSNATEEFKGFGS